MCENRDVSVGFLLGFIEIYLTCNMVQGGPYGLMSVYIVKAMLLNLTICHQIWFAQR